jgi:hypothetical protein
MRLKFLARPTMNGESRKVSGEARKVGNDASPSEPIRLYDKGLMQEPYYDSFGQFQLALRDADVLIPKIPAEEPLKAQDQHFLDCVRTRRQPLSDGVFAHEVVLALEALHHSLRRGGARQAVETFEGSARWAS